MNTNQIDWLKEIVGEDQDVVNFKNLPKSLKDLKIGTLVEVGGNLVLSVEYINSFKEIGVSFLETNYSRVTSYQNLKLGYVRDPTADHRTHNGKGFTGHNTGRHRIQVNGIKTKMYMAWDGMMARCYLRREGYNTKYFREVEVCENWKDFQNFGDWYEGVPQFNLSGWELDKDILSFCAGVYSPESCCVVPKYINNLFRFNAHERSKYGIGVRKNQRGSKYYCELSYKGKTKRQSGFFNPKEAEECYIQHKLKIVKEAAQEYKKDLDTRVYDHIMGLDKLNFRQYFPDGCGGSGE